MEECKIQRDAELRTFTARLKELEGARLAQRFSAEEDLERVVGQFGAEISTYENHVADLQEALQESETHREDLERQLAALSSGPAGSESSDGLPDEERATQDEPAEALRGIETERILAKERIQDLEVQLREARQGSRRTAEHLESGLESLNRLSDPERRLREGISLFNASEHTRTVASSQKPSVSRESTPGWTREPQEGRRSRSYGATWPGAATSPIRRRISMSLRSISPGPATYPPRSTRRAANPTPAWTPGGG